MENGGIYGEVNVTNPYYLEKDYCVDDDSVVIVLHETFNLNRIVKHERLFEENEKDFSLLDKK